MLNAARSASVAVVISMSFILAGCSSSPGTNAEGTKPLVGSGDTAAAQPPQQPVAQGKCPDGVIASLKYNGAPYTEVDISVIETAFGADLPGGAACVTLTQGGVEGDAWFQIFWTGQDQNFANTIANTLVDAGVGAFGDPIEYRKNGADMELWAIAAGDSLNFSDAFDGSPMLVMATGSIPDPGYFG